MSQLSMSPEMAEKPRINTTDNMNCEQIANAYMKGRYKIPLFQREPGLWPLKQRQSFIRGLYEGPPAVGTIVLYQVEDTDDEGWYILDGLQRISTMEDALLAPDKYGFADSDVLSKHLDNNIFPVQKRTYRNHDAAYVIFVRLQENLALTAYEKYYGKRSLLDSWQWFVNVESDIHTKFDKVIASYGNKDITKRENIAKYRRHNLSLFLRFAKSTITPSPWSIADNEVDEKKVMEIHLSAYLQERKKSEVDDRAAQFVHRLDLDRGIIYQAWQQREDYTPGKCPPHTILRFLHEVGIFCAANGTSTPRFKSFVEKIFLFTNGDTQYTYIKSNGRTQKITFGLSKLEHIRMLFTDGQITDNLFTSDSKRRSESTPAMTTERGFDIGHLQPISTHGPGPVQPEPASLNRSKGNRLP